MRAGLKKGAHYSAPMWLLRVQMAFRSRRLSCPAAALGLLVLSGGWGQEAPAVQPEADARKTEAELQAVKSEIERVTRQVSEEQVERDKLSRELRSAEVSVGKAREGLDGVRRGRAERASRRAALAAERRTREGDLDQNRSALAGQLRAAYLIGREEPLKLLLNQKDPERAGRMFVYYSYFGRARAEQIHGIENDVQTIATLDEQLQAEDAKLAQLEKQQRTDLLEIEQAREKRSHVLASLTAESN
jgi:septal ring factor EnvC (AmiA/AmiB activator)